MNEWNDTRIIKTKKPKFKHCFGRTWDYIDCILPDGKKIEARVDSTWGRYAYFSVLNDWYKISMEYNKNWKIDLAKEE